MYKPKVRKPMDLSLLKSKTILGALAFAALAVAWKLGVVDNTTAVAMGAMIRSFTDVSMRIGIRKAEKANG